jgi:hypothetical protein
MRNDERGRGERMGHDMGKGKCDKITAHPSRLDPLKKIEAIARTRDYKKKYLQYK